MRKFRSKLTAAMIILVVVTSFLSVLFAILTVNGKFLERPEMRHVMFGLAAGDVILLIILITMIAIGFILVMRSIMKPILELDKAVSKVTAGDYNVKVDTYNKAEAIVDLLDNFNTMVEQLRNNEYLHKEWRDFLFANGWKWSPFRKCWVKKHTKNSYAFAYKFITGNEYREATEIVDLYLDGF